MQNGKFDRKPMFTKLVSTGVIMLYYAYSKQNYALHCQPVIWNTYFHTLHIKPISTDCSFTEVRPPLLFLQKGALKS